MESIILFSVFDSFPKVTCNFLFVFFRLIYTFLTMGISFKRILIATVFLTIAVVPVILKFNPCKRRKSTEGEVDQTTDGEYSSSNGHTNEFCDEKNDEEILKSCNEEEHACRSNTEEGSSYSIVSTGD